MRVGGLDLSLAATGLAVIDDDPLPGMPTILVRTIKSAPAQRADGRTPSLAERVERLRRIEQRVIVLLGGCPPGTRGVSRLPELVVVEGPSYGSPIGAHEMGGNWHRIVGRLFDLGIDVVEVSPPQVKQYATGSGATSGKNKVEKSDVIAAVRTGYGDIGSGITSSDEADALILAAIGARYLGTPIESAPLPAPNLSAMKKIRWPERTLAL